MMNATPASRFTDSVGVCTHANWYLGAESNWWTLDWASTLIDSGIKYTRSSVARWALQPQLERFFAAGGKLLYVWPGHTPDKIEAKGDIDFLANTIGAQNLCGIESMNEFNRPSSRPADWVAQLRDFTNWMHDTVRANPKLDGVPILAPSIWGSIEDDYTALGNLEPKVDKCCFHYYTAGLRPTLTPVYKQNIIEPLAAAINNARIIAPTKPIWTTEFGYDNPAPNGFPTTWVATEKAGAKYLLRGVFDMLKAGVERTFIYSLMDDPGTTQYWGLCDAALNPRPRFDALKRLMVLFSDTGVVTLKPLDITIAAPSLVRRQLFQKSDGTYLLVLYQDADSYDRTTHEDLDPEAVSVGLSFASPKLRLESFAPTTNTASPVSSGTSCTVAVADHVTVVRITPTI